MAEVAPNRGVAPKYEPTPQEQQALSELERCIQEARRWHTDFARRVERRYQAWRGMAPENAPTSWRSNIHPPHLIGIVEGMLSSLEEGEPVFEVTGRSLPGMDPQEAADQHEKAVYAGYLLNQQMRCDDFAQKQSPFAQQDLIAGFTVGKISWLRDRRRVNYNDRQPQMMYDETGGTIALAEKLDQYSQTVTFKDDPTFIPRDVRDFLYPESATSLETAPWVIDRAYVTFRTLERMEKVGVYQNVEYLRDYARIDSTHQGTGIDFVGEREMKLRNADRTRGLVEVLELWSDDRVITVANRAVVLRDVSNPFWHGQKPFVVCSAIPDMFQIPGVSVIEGLAAMQDMLWTLTNMRIDATRMLGNVITVIRGDIDNADDYEWAPNAQWFVPDPQAVKTLDINPEVAKISLDAENLLRGDIQSMMGGLPATGGAPGTTQLDNQTATGVSIITNIAQQILQRRKQMYLRCFAKVAQLFLQNDQQFLREPRTIEIFGPGGAKRWQQIDPVEDIGKAYFDVNVKMTGDSMMRQEVRAESGQLLTQAMQFGPVAAQMGVHLDGKAFWEKHLNAFGEYDTEKFFKEAPVAPPQAADGPPVPQIGPATPAGADTLMADMAGQPQPGGTTNEALAAGPTSPSSDASMSPAVATSRALASVGSGRSV